MTQTPEARGPSKKSQWIRLELLRTQKRNNMVKREKREGMERRGKESIIELNWRKEKRE